MGHDVTHKQLMEALSIYQEKYGQMSTIKMDPRKWDDILLEVKYGKKKGTTGGKVSPSKGQDPDG